MTSPSPILEPAIPLHLTTERTHPSSLPPGYRPPFPAYCAGFPESMQNLTMAVIGFQHPEPTSSESSQQNSELHVRSRSKLLRFLQCHSSSQPDETGDGNGDGDEDVRPQHYTLATYTDPDNHHNEAFFAYWPGHSSYSTWASKSGFGAFWENLAPGEGQVGWFLEVFSPSMDRFETIFSDDTIPEGAAHMRENVSGAVREHVYWGSMRDRLAVSQTDFLEGEEREGRRGRERAEVEVEVGDTKARRIRVAGRKNLCVIRSGQDWSGTNARERELYLETMHPVLVKGMEFLTNQGGEVGCLSNRFMDVVDHDDPTRPTDKTFGLGYFESIASLEGWSKQHKTHLDIFGRFLQYAAELQNDVTLRLFHEVVVLRPEQQFFEYVGCHPGTGLLGSMAGNVVA